MFVEKKGMCEGEKDKEATESQSFVRPALARPRDLKLTPRTSSTPTTRYTLSSSARIPSLIPRMQKDTTFPRATTSKLARLLARTGDGVGVGYWSWTGGGGGRRSGVKSAGRGRLD